MSTDLLQTQQDSEFSETELREPVAENKFSKDGCSNCGTQLSGKFCHGCGQPSRSIIKFFGQVVVDVLDDVIGYDSRLKHTIVPLLFKPGKITIDYIQGRIFHYVLPIRLYLILSVVCILMVQAITDFKDINMENVTTTIEANDGKLDKEELEKAQKLLDASGVDIDLSKQVIVGDVDKAVFTSQKKLTDLTLKDAQSNSTAKTNSFAESDSSKNQSVDDSVGTNHSAPSKNVEVSNDYFDLDYNESDESFAFHGQFYRDYPQTKAAVADIYKKSKGWKEDPTPLINQLFELFPIMMFIILPLFAIALKILYIFKKRYYIEHLVFCLHNHCFIYFALILEILLDLLEKQVAQYEHWAAQMLASITSFASVALAFWIVIYIAVAMKRVYQQGWFLTLTKMTLLGMVYFSFLMIGLFVTAIIGAWQA